MKINIVKISEYIVYLINFIGFYTIIALMMAIGFVNESRFYTIPMRLLEVVLIFFLILMKRYKPCDNKMVYFLFGWFFNFYLLKIILEMIKGTTGLHIPGYEFVLYSFIYVFIPFIFFSQKKSFKDYELMFKAIYLSGVLLSVLSLYFFIKVTLSDGQFDRYKSVFDPLIFSYSGALLIGVCIMKLLFDSGNVKKKIMLVAGILMGIIPFLIGGSRGPILALIIPLIISLLYYNNFKIRFKYLLYSVLAIIILIFATTLFGEQSFKRLFNIFKDLASGSGEVIRLDIWKTSFNQFLHSPVWGDSIQKDGGSYPHNLLLEVLMATGIIGFIPYFTLLIYGMNRSIKIIRQNPPQSWIFLFFILTFIMGMLSGNVYSDIWYWSSLALVFSVDLEINRSQQVDHEPVN